MVACHQRGVDRARVRVKLRLRLRARARLRARPRPRLRARARPRLRQRQRRRLRLRRRRRCQRAVRYHLGELVHADIEECEPPAALDADHGRQAALRHRQPLQLAHAVQPDDLRDDLHLQRERFQVRVAGQDAHVAVGQAVHEELEVCDCARLPLVLRARDAAGAQVVEVDACSVVVVWGRAAQCWLTVRFLSWLPAPSNQGRRPLALRAHGQPSGGS